MKAIERSDEEAAAARPDVAFARAAVFTLRSRENSPPTPAGRHRILPSGMEPTFLVPPPRNFLRHSMTNRFENKFNIDILSFENKRSIKKN